MLALRLARAAHPLVHLRRLLVAAASAGTGFLLLCTLGYAMAHPQASTGSALRLAWCLAPMAATVYFAVAVARTDPGTRPRSGLAAIGLGPGRLMALSALTTALSTVFGSLLALLAFLHVRGDLPGGALGGRAADFLATDQPLPLPAALTLLAVVPVTASLASALVLRPHEERRRRAGRRKAEADADTEVSAEVPGTVVDPDRPAAPRPAPGGLPWGVAALAAGLAVETYAGRTSPAAGPWLPGDPARGPLAVPVGWALTALGLLLAGPALTYLCGRLLQAVRPGAVRLLAGRGLQEEAGRIGRPLGVVSAVASGAYATAALSADATRSFGPLTALGALLVTGCTLATLAVAAIEARQARAATVAGLVRLGAPATLLRNAVLLRAAVLIVVFVPLTWAVAELAALPLRG
ncbi:hypothetical protein AB0L85_08850 [Streptomyces sp. NPDC052051]|uniref:hypothetical protein n=1 Tax=Streptomyces sp. NPDC052051 TaxID=3154649 RepID=UPI0034239D16